MQDAGHRQRGLSAENVGRKEVLIGLIATVMFHNTALPASQLEGEEARKGARS